LNKFYNKKYINTGFVIALLILIAVNLVIFLNIRFHFEDEKVITDALQTIQITEALYTKIIETSANRRGYLITNNLEFMEDYYPALKETDSLYSRLRQITADNPKEQAILDTLGKLIYSGKDIWQESIELQEKKLKNEKAQIEFTKKSKEVQDKVKQLTDDIKKVESAGLQNRLQEADESANYALTNLLIGNVIAFLLLITVIILLNRNINSRMQVEKNLEESRNLLSTTLESIKDSVIVASKIGEVLFMNKAAESITGWKLDEARGMLLDHIFNVHCEETKEKCESPLTKIFNPSLNYDNINHKLLSSKNKSAIPIDESSAPLVDSNGNIEGVVIVFRDISERRKAEKELLNSRKFIERIADSVPSIIYIYSLKGPRISYVNYKIVDFLGYTPTAAVKMNDKFFEELIHPEDLASLKRLYEKYSKAKDNEILDYEYRIKNSKGEWRWFRSHDVVFSRGKDDFVNEMLGSALDVTEEKNMEEELKKYSGHLEELVTMRTSELQAANVKLRQEINERAKAERNIIDAEEKFRSLVENSLVGIYIIQDDKYAYTNPKYDEIFGYKRGELLGKNVWDVVDENSKDEVINNIRRRLDNEIESIQYSFKANRKDGSIIDVEVRGTKMLYEGRLAIIGTLQDITDRKKYEDEINRQKEFLRTVIDTDPNFVFAKDWSGKFTLVNKAVAEVYGTTVDELIGKTDADFNTNKDEVESFLAADREVISSGSSKFISEEKVSNPATGEAKWYQTIKVPLKEKDGSLQVLGVSADITARKLAEEITKKSLQEKELLLKEIHHRVKNNLQIIVSLLKLQSRYVKDPKDLNIFNSSRSRVETMSLIHEKLYKSRDISDIDLGGYIKDLVSHILKAYNVNHEEISFSLIADEVKLSIDTAIPCGLIINELVNNILKYAFPPGYKGRIEIKIKKSSDDIILEVSDNGVGIPSSFDINNSDSLGLQLVDTLIKQISGNVVTDTLNGTKFTIKFKEIKYRERI
jgi:PAS domain S-box-containing protein